MQLCKLCFFLSSCRKKKTFSQQRSLYPPRSTRATCPALQQRRTARNRNKLWAAETSKHKWGSGKLGVPTTMSTLYMHIVTHTYINKCSWQFKVILIWKQMLCLACHVPQLLQRTQKKNNNISTLVRLSHIEERKNEFGKSL